MAGPSNTRGREIHAFRRTRQCAAAYRKYRPEEHHLDLGNSTIVRKSYNAGPACNCSRPTLADSGLVSGSPHHQGDSWRVVRAGRRPSFWTSLMPDGELHGLLLVF